MFDQLIGNERARAVLRRMLEQRRVPGALIFAGEEGVGKKLFALELAKALNCRTPRGVEACDECSACVRIARLANASDEATGLITWGEHQDVGLVRPEKRFITVDQARAVERETNFRPYEGRARVIIIEEADRMNAQAGNALLKTLEEAPPSAHLILLTTRTASLLPTIRSRCQLIRFAPLTAGEIEAYLVKHKQRAGTEARLAAQLAQGRLGRALSLNLDQYREQRDAMLTVLEALAARSDRVQLLRAAEDLSDAKRKDVYEPSLDALELLIHDAWRLALDPKAEIVNDDIRERLTRLSGGVTNRRFTAWLASIEELRAQLAVNVNRRIATDALLLSMAAIPA
ncbi:MAG: DNA polymerase III subunit delta' [Acidobacteria bacterium]|nr:MAG: DNA polymerase III subunit delta' [Acidobacteriota bacterium]